MAKRRKKKNLTSIIGGSVGAVVLIVAIVIISLLLVTPSVDGLKGGFEKDGLSCVLVGSVGDGKDAGGIDATLTGASVSIGSSVSGKAITVTYYATDDQAKEAYKSAKGKLSDDDKKTTAVVRRGKAVFVGSKSEANTFRFQLG